MLVKISMILKNFKGIESVWKLSLYRNQKYDEDTVETII